MASHMEIAHRWAQMNSRLSVKGYAMYAEGHSIYSWGSHFEIARWVPTLASERVRTTQSVPAMCIMFNADGYSTSTAKHKAFTRRAIPSNTWVFGVPARLWGDHKAALAYFEAEALEELQKASRARVYADSHLSRANALLNTAQNYALAFRVKWARPETSDLTARAEKRAKAQAAEARKAAKRRALAEALRRETDAEVFMNWRVGASHYVPSTWRVAADGSAYVRRNGDDLETSQGARVPWAHAVKAFRFIKLVRASGKAFHTNGRTIRVGHFTVDSIDTQGNMRAGCHLFAWAEIERLAKAEGVFDLDPSEEAVTAS